jgi:hypothetical protein
LLLPTSVIIEWVPVLVAVERVAPPSPTSFRFVGCVGRAVVGSVAAQRDDRQRASRHTVQLSFEGGGRHDRQIGVGVQPAVAAALEASIGGGTTSIS